MDYYRADQPPSELSIARGLVELLRTDADLPHSRCVECASALVRYLARTLADVQQLPAIDRLLSEGDVTDVANCSDALRLSAALDDLSECKRDSQQRSWALFEDADHIIDRLGVVAHLSIQSDRRVPVRVFENRDFEALLDLIDFYQMETRLPVKYAFAQCFTAVFRLCQRFIRIASQSTLPIWLSSEYASSTDNNSAYSINCLLLLGDIYSIETLDMPLSHHVENDDTSEALVDAAIRFILAYNLHFVYDAPASPMQCIRNSTVQLKRFGERLLMLLNRCHDPVMNTIVDEGRDVKNSVHPSSVAKYWTDVYSSGVSCIDRLLYSNDVPVLADVVIRILIDQPIQSQLRRDHVALAKSMIASGTLDAAKTDQINEALSYDEGDRI